MWSIISLFLIAHQIFILNQVKKFILDMVRISLSYLHKQSFLCDKIPHQHSLMGNIYELYYFYPTCIASGFIYELIYLYPAPSASGNHLLLKLEIYGSYEFINLFFKLFKFFCAFLKLLFF